MLDAIRDHIWSVIICRQLLFQNNTVKSEIKSAHFHNSMKDWFTRQKRILSKQIIFKTILQIAHMDAIYNNDVHFSLLTDQNH